MVWHHLVAFIHILKRYWIEVCISVKMRQDKTRLAITSRIGNTMTKLLLSGHVVQENLGKNLEKNGTGLVSTPRKSLEQSQILILFSERLKKQYQARLFWNNQLKLTMNIKTTNSHWQCLFTKIIIIAIYFFYLRCNKFEE